MSLISAVTAAAQFGSPPPRGPAGRTATAPHVRVELLASPKPVAGTLWFGIRFELDDGWHLYWQNPGDSGGPPEADWQAPPHMRVGAFEWPSPERIDVAGLVNYGYHGTVVLPVPVTITAGAPATGTIAASLRWMVCKDMCVGGKGRVEIALPLAGPSLAEAPAWEAAIAGARALVPKPAPAAWTARAASARDTFTVVVRTGRREDRAVFFPLQVSQVNDSAPQRVTPLPDGVSIVLRKSDQLTSDPPALKGVLTLSGSRSFVVSAPVAR